MVFRESEIVELKEIVTDEIKKEIIAFANSEGGKIYIGVQDNGTVTGLDDSDSAALRISNMVRDAIKPDLTLFIHYQTLEIEGKQVVEVDVQRGTERPYYIAKKGLRPEGVYVRQGYSAVPATNTAIRRMIKETDGDRFEEMRSIEQNLTFTVAEKEFKERGMEFGVRQMQTLKILNCDGIYTNTGLLLSDQCPHTIKTAVFQGEDQSIFRDRQEFGGSLLQQMNDVYDYIDRYNEIHADFEGLRRIDTRNYPQVAIREALLNVLVHRDYAFSASALISVYSDRMEFISIGGLLSGLELDDIMAGVSACRNQNLANVFYRLELIEAYGTGIRKILKAYENEKNKPVIENTSNAFKITLPNINIKRDSDSHLQEEVLTDNNIENQVLQLAESQNFITRAEIEILLGSSSSTASRVLKQMVEKNLLVRCGKGRIVRYAIPKNK